MVGGASHLEKGIDGLLVASRDEVHAPKHITLVERRMIRVETQRLLYERQSFVRFPGIGEGPRIIREDGCLIGVELVGFLERLKTKIVLLPPDVC
jgi:hypothetical protein